MKLIETVKLGSELLKFLSRNGIYIDDYRYIDAYEEFCMMRKNGVKYETAIAEIARERKVSRRTLQRAFRRLSREC